jgi:hypothetical protein
MYVDGKRAVLRWRRRRSGATADVLAAEEERESDDPPPRVGELTPSEMGAQG